MWSQITHYTLSWQRVSVGVLPSWRRGAEGANFLQEIETQCHDASPWALRRQTHWFFNAKAESQRCGAKSRKKMGNYLFWVFFWGFSLYYKRGCLRHMCERKKLPVFQREKGENTLKGWDAWEIVRLSE